MNKYWISIISILMVLVIVPFFQSCQEEEVAPCLTLENETIYVDSPGGQQVIGYTLVYPKENAEVRAECSADWIQDFNNETEGEIRFFVQENLSGNERNATITLYYPGISENPEINVFQRPADKGLKLVINEIQTTSVTFSLTRDDPQMAYILEIISKEDLEENGLATDEALWKSNLEAFEQEAMIYGETLEETIMNQHARTEDLMNEKVEFLQPEHSYIIYAYGLKVKGNEIELLTPIYRKEFKTLALASKETEFRLTADVKGAKATIRIEPIDFTGPYYADVSVERLSPEEATLTAHQNWNMLREELQMYGYTTDQIIQEFTIRGIREAVWDLNAETDYTAYAFAINPDDGMPYSDASIVNFRTEAVKPSDNRISISISDVKARSFFVTASPTNQDPYFSATVPSIQLEGMEEAEIIDFMLYNYTHKTVCGGFTEKVDHLEPNTEYSVVMFGMDGGIATTELFRKDTVTLDVNDLETTIEIIIDKHYDIEEVIELDPSLSDFQTYGDAFLHMKIKTDPEDTPAELCYFNVISLDAYEAIGIELTDDLLINNLIMMGAQSYKDKMIGINYGERMIGAAVIMDDNGNIGRLFKSEPFTCQKAEASDAHEFLNWMKGPDKMNRD